MSIILRVDDLGRRPGDPVDRGTDNDLEWFMEWRERSGLRGRPVIYAAVPAWLSEKGLFHLKNLTRREVVAVHGTDHKEGHVFTIDDFQRGRDILGSDIFVPPYGVQDNHDLDLWRSVGGKYWLGGLNGTQHQLGQFPIQSHGVTHLSKSSNAHKCLMHPCPFVFTVNVAEVNDIAEAREELSRYLVGLDEVDDWLQRESLDLEKMKAKKFSTYDWILHQLTDPLCTVFDFGCSDSELTSLMALRAKNVSCWDRDYFRVSQTELARQKQVSVRCLEGPTGSHDVVTASWAIGFNPPEDIPGIVKMLAGLVKPGGRLLVVDAYRHGTENCPELVIDSSGMQLTETLPFWYVSGKTAGGLCGQKDANAICLSLRKS